MNGNSSRFRKLFFHFEGFAVLYFIVFSVEVQSAIDKPTEEQLEITSCIVEGFIYKHGERIPRENPCHVCLCLRSQVSCAWQDCPLPPEGCSAMTFTGMCNPSLYVCSIPEQLGPEAQVHNQNVDILPESLDGVEEAYAACVISGVPYETGDVVGAASHNCLECRCGRQDLYCSPRCCFRWSSFIETPGQIMKALRIGPKVPALHPLHHLISALNSKP